MTNFIACLVKHFRIEGGLHFPQDQFDDVEHADLAFVRKIERLAAKGPIRGEALGEHHVSGCAIFDIEIIADEVTVRAHDWTFAANDGANGSRDYPIPVQVAAAVEIAAPRDGNGKVVTCGISLRDQVGARLAYIVRMAAC